MKKVFIFVPAFGNMLTATTFLSTHQISQMLTSKSIGASVSTLSFPDIAELRSMVATIWHDTMPDIDYLLFIDADMGVDPNMILDMMLFDEPIVGTIYPQRKLPVSWAGSGEGSPQSERRANFMRVEGVGMGCTLIHKSVVQTILTNFPELADYRIDLHPAQAILRQAGANRIIRCFEKLNIPERGIVSEDLSFCIRYRRCGVNPYFRSVPGLHPSLTSCETQVWAAIGYDVSHVGQFDYRGNYLQHITQATQAAEAPVVPWMPQPSQPPVMAPLLPAGAVPEIPMPPIPPGMTEAEIAAVYSKAVEKYKSNGGDRSDDKLYAQDEEALRQYYLSTNVGERVEKHPKRKRGRPRKEKPLAEARRSA